jgi:hypothetical protein
MWLWLHLSQTVLAIGSNGRISETVGKIIEGIYDDIGGIEWRWQSFDNASITELLGGGDDTGPNPTDRCKLGSKRQMYYLTNMVFQYRFSLLQPQHAYMM